MMVLESFRWFGGKTYPFWVPVNPAMAGNNFVEEARQSFHEKNVPLAHLGDGS